MLEFLCSVYYFATGYYKIPALCVAQESFRCKLRTIKPETAFSLSFVQINRICLTINTQYLFRVQFLTE